MVTQVRPAAHAEHEGGGDDEFHVDPETLVADVTDEELVGDLLELRPTEGEAEQYCVIVDNIPAVERDKVDMLRSHMRKKYFAKLGEHTADFALDEHGGTKGYVFVEFGTKEAAQQAAHTLNNVAIDKKHTMSVNLFADLHRRPETRLQPRRQYKDPGRLLWWLEDPNACVDQFAVVFAQGATVAVYNNMLPEPALVSDDSQRSHWTESTIEWSPRGTYLATFHDKGIALWGGPQYQRAKRFAHNAVSSISFSPCETYLVTYSNRGGRGYGTAHDALKVWNMHTEELERSFPVGPNDDRVDSWPYFRWSHDGRYFAALREDQGIWVYETETFKLLDKKPIECEGIRDCQWSPKDYLLAFWVSEKQARPAKVGLLSIPDKTELRAKNLFKVVDAWLHWQNDGDYLAIKVDRYGKRKEEEGKGIKYTSMSYHVEVFRVRDKSIPVETIELKEQVVNLAWEPRGDRLCILVGSERKSTPTFYSFAKGTTTMLKQLEGVVALNAIQWAPAGQWLVLGSLRSSDMDVPASGSLIFVDCAGGEPVRSAQVEHAACSSILMDPTGRYCISLVSYWVSRGADFGYRMYTSQGRVIQKQAISGLCLVAWRPRPPTILPEAKIKEIRRNMKHYAGKYEKEDERQRSRASKDVLERRRVIAAEFAEWHELALMEVADMKEYRIELRGTDTDAGCESVEMEEETIEMPIECEKVVLQVCDDDD